MTADQTGFLTMISLCEGTAREADPYRVCFAFRHTIVDLSDHPAVTGEWRGEPLDFLGSAYVGEVSTAAGRYQINKRTWLQAATALSLPDFGAASQDAAALWLIREQGALKDLDAGNARAAIAKCHNIWASLPGGNSGQPEDRLALCLQYFIQGGGVVTAAA